MWCRIQLTNCVELLNVFRGAVISYVCWILMTVSAIVENYKTCFNDFFFTGEMRRQVSVELFIKIAVQV